MTYSQRSLANSFKQRLKEIFNYKFRKHVQWIIFYKRERDKLLKSSIWKMSLPSILSEWRGFFGKYKPSALYTQSLKELSRGEVAFPNIRFSYFTLSVLSMWCIIWSHISWTSSPTLERIKSYARLNKRYLWVPCYLMKTNPLDYPFDSITKHILSEFWNWSTFFNI